MAAEDVSDMAFMQLFVNFQTEVSKRHLDHQMRGFLYEAVVEHLQNTLRNLDQVLDSQGGAAAAAEAPPPRQEAAPQQRAPPQQQQQAPPQQPPQHAGPSQREIMAALEETVRVVSQAGNLRNVYKSLERGGTLTLDKLAEGVQKLGVRHSAELIKAAAAQFTESNTMAYGNFVRMVSAVPH